MQATDSHVHDRGTHPTERRESHDERLAPIVGVGQEEHLVDDILRTLDPKRVGKLSHHPHALPVSDVTHGLEDSTRFLSESVHQAHSLQIRHRTEVLPHDPKNPVIIISPRRELSSHNLRLRDSGSLGDHCDERVFDNPPRKSSSLSSFLSRLKPLDVRTIRPRKNAVIGSVIRSHVLSPF